MNDKEIDEEIAKKTINPYYFGDETLKIGFKINLESHNINHANSFLNIIPNFQISELKKCILINFKRNGYYLC